MVSTQKTQTRYVSASRAIARAAPSTATSPPTLFPARSASQFVAPSLPLPSLSCSPRSREGRYKLVEAALPRSWHECAGRLVDDQELAREFRASSPPARSGPAQLVSGRQRCSSHAVLGISRSNESGQGSSTRLSAEPRTPVLRGGRAACDAPPARPSTERKKWTRSWPKRAPWPFPADSGQRTADSGQRTADGPAGTRRSSAKASARWRGTPENGCPLRSCPTPRSCRAAISPAPEPQSAGDEVPRCGRRRSGYATREARRGASRSGRPTGDDENARTGLSPRRCGGPR